MYTLQIRSEEGGGENGVLYVQPHDREKCNKIAWPRQSQIDLEVSAKASDIGLIAYLFYIVRSYPWNK